MTPWRKGDLLRLETERFVVRSMTREDMTDAVIGWMADPAVMVGLNMPARNLTRPQAVRWVLSHDNASKFFLAICTSDTEQVIGFFIVTINTNQNVAETSVVLGNQEFWGKDVVLETRSALLDFLFDTIGVYKVIGRPHGRNFSSIYNYKALGFTCEAILREHMRAIEGDQRLDQLIFGMLKSEWLARREDAGQ